MNNEEIHHRNGAPLGRREDLLLAAAKASGMLPGGYCKGQKICTISIKPQCANNLELDYSSSKNSVHPMMPALISGVRKWASSAAMIRSQAATAAKPAPATLPCAAATVGFGQA